VADLACEIRLEAATGGLFSAALADLAAGGLLSLALRDNGECCC